jgi:energy-coupling factor transport system permease protein
MLENVSLGTYYPGYSLLHRLQARTKLLALFWIAFWLLFSARRLWHFTPFIVVVLLVIVGTLVAGVSLREMGRRLRLLIILLIVGSITTPFYRGNDARALYTIGPLFTTYGMAQMVLLVCCAVLVILSLSSLLPLPGVRKLWQRSQLKRSRPLLILLTLIALVTFWVISGPSPARPFVIGPLIVKYGGVWLLVSVSVTLLSLYVFSLLLTMTTTPVALVEGLTMLLSPLRRLKLPVDEFALMALLALRFIPTLIEEVMHLIKAQTARGADLTHGSLRERLQSLTMLFVPLIRSVLRRAAELATALEARGYDIEGRQTPLHESSLGRLDYLVLLFVVCITIGSMLF